MSSREDIGKGRLVYTCNCGWVDKNHMEDPSTRPFVGVKNLWKQILTETGRNTYFPSNENGFKVTYRQDVKRLGVYIGVTKSYLVKRGIPHNIKESVALTILREVSLEFESFQGWAGPFSDSSFSVEDLISNLIGFYYVVRPNIDYMKLCKPASKDASYKVWDIYGAVGSHKNKVFHPTYFNCDECDSSKRYFPSELNKIHPVTKSSSILKPNEYFRDWFESDDWVNGIPPIKRPVY